MSSESTSSFTFPEEVPHAVPMSLYSSSAPNSTFAYFGNAHPLMKSVKVESASTEVSRLRDIILEKEKEIARLQRETNKLKSVIEKSELTRLPSISSYQQGGSVHPIKKCGVSGESWLEDQGDSTRLKEQERLFKDFRARQLIRAALSENDLLQNLDADQIRDIVDFMHPQNFCPGAYVIQEGEPGSHLYVSAEGQLEVLQDTRHLGTLGPGKAFGELALLYNCKRTATVRGISKIIRETIIP
ncbi:unnamed protein product [Allacma fusca]|uniref:Cyclic nucleotide-binding domain-containing protein n=1 Tax=Allacma fusca TaxID=39272 RepID=A0A8J2LFX8_9HEXA|nr:unnamed protein product [Allacma fusca]